MAAIKAVVSIEAGGCDERILGPGVPVINFDRTMCTTRFRSKVSDKKRRQRGEGPLRGFQDMRGASGHSLINARKVNAQGVANMGTFWGMFQIGGFNYKLCGCKSVMKWLASQRRIPEL